MHLPTAASGDAEVPSEDNPSNISDSHFNEIGDRKLRSEDAKVPSVFAPTSPKSPASGRYPRSDAVKYDKKSLMVSFPPPCG